MPASIVGAVVGVAGLGMQAAGAAGAFNGPVQKAIPTKQDYENVKAARDVYNIGRKIQSPLDALARQDLRYLGSDQALASAGSQAVNQQWAQMGPLGQQLNQVAAQSGGPGSGRFWGQLGQGTAALDSGVRQANVQGRMGGLNQYIARNGQFLARRSRDLDAGLGAMITGGAQSAQNQMMNIQQQMANNAATSQAMGGLGGSMAGAGMGVVQATGGMQGIADAGYSIGNFFGAMV